MLTQDQMFAVRATFGNVKPLYDEMMMFARNINDGAYDMYDVLDYYDADFGACLKLANDVNYTFPWANVSACDIPQAVYDYLDEVLEDFAA